MKKDKYEDEEFSITMELQKPIIDEEKEQKKENPKNYKKYFFVGIIILFLGMFSFTFIWLIDSYEAKELAESSIISDENISVTYGDFITFKPKEEVDKGFILYPGAKVEAKAYSYLAREIAKRGYQVVVVDMPLNIAFLSQNKAQEVILKYPNIKHWFIGGHSMGGVAACNFASSSNEIDGIVLLASYPSNESLKNSNKRVLSIWGTKDGVLNFEHLLSSKENLPKDTTYVEIEGGNHAQFGDYGKQKGDGEAAIDTKEQVDLTVDNIVEFMENTGK